MAVNNCRNILVRGVNWIGDAVMTMPALRVLKHADPDAVITLLVKPWVSPLFERDPSVDEIIIYKDEFTGIPGKMKLAHILRKHRFCRAVLFQKPYRTRKPCRQQHPRALAEAMSLAMSEVSEAIIMDIYEFLKDRQK